MHPLQWGDRAAVEIAPGPRLRCNIICLGFCPSECLSIWSGFRVLVRVFRNMLHNLCVCYDASTAYLISECSSDVRSQSRGGECKKLGYLPYRNLGIYLIASSAGAKRPHLSPRNSRALRYAENCCLGSLADLSGIGRRRIRTWLSFSIDVITWFESRWIRLLLFFGFDLGLC